MAIALPITSAEDPPHSDPRHYTSWEQVRSPQYILPPNTPVEDVGTTSGAPHYTDWTPKARP